MVKADGWTFKWPGKFGLFLYMKFHCSYGSGPLGPQERMCDLEKGCLHPLASQLGGKNKDQRGSTNL